jgi:hypothetical protein
MRTVTLATYDRFMSLSGVLAGAGIILAGVLMIIFRRPLARLSVEGQRWTWGFRFGERTVRYTERVAIPLTGAAFIAFGVAWPFLVH